MIRYRISTVASGAQYADSLLAAHRAAAILTSAGETAYVMRVGVVVDCRNFEQFDVARITQATSATTEPDPSGQAQSAQSLSFSTNIWKPHIK